MLQLAVAVVSHAGLSQATERQQALLEQHSQLSPTLANNGDIADWERAAQETQRAQARVTKLFALFALFTIITSLLVGVWIVRSVARPIVSIADTFSLLARGEEAQTNGLDHTSRVDEIGAMARAAEVFASRNRDGRRLLAEAAELGEIQAVTNAKLTENVRELRQRNEDLDGFCYSASHDLKAPLRAISLLANWIEEDEENQLSKESRFSLRTLEARAMRLQGLLEGLLEYSRLGRTDDLSEEFDVLELVIETVEDISESCPAAIQVVGVSSAMRAPLIAVRKCVQNLIDNSIQHHDRESPTISVTVKCGDDGFTTIAVHDDGPGIPPELHSKILEIFQTLRPRDEHESSGIGLAIVKRLVDNHGASLEIDSDGVRGCSISIRWPTGLPEGRDVELRPALPLAPKLDPRLDAWKRSSLITELRP